MRRYNLRSNDSCYEISKEEFEHFIESGDSSEDEADEYNPSGYCYFIQLLPEVLSGTPIYKIGRATEIFKRMGAREYQNARIICTREVYDMYECEKELIETFKERYLRIRESKNTSYGLEYFKGNEYDMLMLFNQICDKYSQAYFSNQREYE